MITAKSIEKKLRKDWGIVVSKTDVRVKELLERVARVFREKSADAIKTCEEQDIDPLLSEASSNVNDAHVQCDDEGHQSAIKMLYFSLSLKQVLRALLAEHRSDVHLQLQRGDVQIMRKPGLSGL